jgi:hypothetical protein
MSKTRLNIVASASEPETLGTVTHLAPVVSESRAQKVLRLQEEARALAREQVSEFEALMQATSDMAREIAEGGESYAVGARELCRRLSEELVFTAGTLRAILNKA